MLLHCLFLLKHVGDELDLLNNYHHKDKDNGYPCLHCYDGFAPHTCNRIKELKAYQDYLQKKLDSLSQIPKVVETQHDPLPIMFQSI